MIIIKTSTNDTIALEDITLDEFMNLPITQFGLVRIPVDETALYKQEPMVIQVKHIVSIIEWSSDLA